MLHTCNAITVKSCCSEVAVILQHYCESAVTCCEPTLKLLNVQWFLTAGVQVVLRVDGRLGDGPVEVGGGPHRQQVAGRGGVPHQVSLLQQGPPQTVGQRQVSVPAQLAHLSIHHHRVVVRVKQLLKLAAVVSRCGWTEN